MKIRVKYVLSHVVQYYVPLIQRLARCEDIDLEVIFGTDAGAKPYFDPGFAREISWDQPLLEGYRFKVLQPGAPVRTGLFQVATRGLGPLLTPATTDMVITLGWFGNLYLTATLTALRRGIPLLFRTELQPHNKGRAAFRWLKPLIVHPLLRRVDGHLAIGSLNREYYLSKGVRPDRIFWAPYSIDTPLFLPERVSPAETDNERQRLGLDRDSLQVIFVGKLIPVKRPADVIAAAAALPRGCKAEVIFVGDGELRPALERMAREMGVTAHFLGFRNQSELARCYSLADVLVLPSSHEPWGLVVNEAMTMGLPAIVSDVVGCGPDLVREGRTGCICKVGDVAGLARALERMASDPDHLRQLKQNARERIQDFSIDATLRGFVEAIQTVAARARAKRAPSP